MFNKAFRWHNLLISVPLSFSILPALTYAACNSGDIGGNVYLELPVATGGTTANIYGQKDSNESGLANVTVKVIDSTGAEQSATTDSTGAWSVTAPTFPVRVEFNASGVSSRLYSGAVGGQSQSSVRFISATSCNTDMGFQRPEDYSQPDPRLLIPGYRNGFGDTYTETAVFSFPRSTQGLNQAFYNANGVQGTAPLPSSEATHAQVGSLWGVAWQPNQKRAFASTFLKRHVGVRNGLGTVYVFDESTTPGTLAGNFNLQGVTPANGGNPMDFGSVCRDAICANDAGNTGDAGDYVLATQLGDPSIDMDAFYKVGTVGFGDIDMQPSTNTLWLINAYQKALISVDVSGNTASLANATVNQYPFSALNGTPNCTGGQIHPWALGFFDGKGYVGLTCDAIDSQNPDDLHAYIMRFDPAKVSDGLTAVLDFSLNYPREDDWKRFQPWMTPTTAHDKLFGKFVYDQIDFPHGILSDIDFDENGNMFFEIMDLFSHQTGSNNHLPFSRDASYIIGITNSDILKACKTPLGFSLEGTAGCAVNFSGSYGPNAAGEFFHDQVGDGRVEGVSGSIAILRGAQQLDSASMDPHPEGQTGKDYWSTQGVVSYSLNNGVIENWYSLTSESQAGTFGKAIGFGDIELLTASAPVEIGNRVWLDDDRNGIQDAAEVGIDGVQITLTCGADTATTVTANGGVYGFNSAGNATFMDAGENCTISIPAGQALLSTYSLTVANADHVTDNNSVTDIRDSDADNTSTIAFTVGNAGENNHSLDIGYNPPVPKTDLKLLKSVDKPSAKPDETVIYTLSVTNESTTDATGVEVSETLPTRLVYISDDGAGSYDVTSGIWQIGNLAKGETKTLQLTVKVQ